MAKSKSFNTWMARDDDDSNDVVFCLRKPKMDLNGVWDSDSAIARVCGDIAPRTITFLGLKVSQMQRVRITIETIDE